VQIAVERALMRMDQFQAGTRLESLAVQPSRAMRGSTKRARARGAARCSRRPKLGEQVGYGGEAESARQAGSGRCVERRCVKLPEEQREAVALVCVEGLAYREAADALGVPIGTLTSRLARGREALQVMLGGAK
jgi:DNA-directed RNA polymerase specialized sigma24 family protein